LETISWFHLAATSALAGLIWTVQLAQYPAFRWVGTEEFGAFHREHSVHIAWIVGPLMPAEMAAAIALVAGTADGARRWAIAGLGLVVLIWLSTAFVQIPIHARLGRGKDPAAISRLIATNWVRTLAWSARVAIAWRLVALLRGG